MKKSHSNILLIHFLIILSLWGFSLIFLNSKRKTNAYYFDEVSWICNSRVWPELVSSRWQSQVWTEDIVQKLNPQLAKYVLGAWVYTKYHQVGYDIFSCPGWGNLMSISGLENLNLKQREVLFWTRIPMMTFGIVSIVLIYLIGSKLFNKCTGIIASLLTLFNPLFTQSINRAMPDSFLLMVGLILLLIFINSSQYLCKQLSVKTDLLLGILLGLLVSIKMYGLIFLFFIVIFMFINSLSQKIVENSWKSFRFSITNIIVIITSMIVVVYLFNPILWDHKTSLITWFIDFRKFQTDLQSMPQNASLILTNPVTRSQEIWRAFIYPGAWNTFIIPHQSAALLFIGVCISFYKTITAKSLNSYAILLVLMLTLSVSMLFYLPFKFERYYLPLVPPLLLLETLPITQLLRYSLQFLRGNHKN